MLDDNPATTPATTARAAAEPLMALPVQEVDAPAAKPWYRRPSAYWIMAHGFILVLTAGMTDPAKPELLIGLASAPLPQYPIPEGVLSDSAFDGTEVDALWPYPDSDPSLGLSASPANLRNRTTTVSRPFPDTDPESCRKDHGVQRFAAKITMGMTIISGILTVLTTGFWGSLSDRWGRTRIIAVSQMGITLGEICFITIIMYPKLALPVWPIYVGPVLLGMCGGLSAFNTSLTGYVADCAGTRSMTAYLSLVIGVIRAGAVVGPMSGTFLINLTGDALMPLKAAIAVHIFLIFWSLIIVPESLPAESREAAIKAAEVKAEAVRASGLSKYALCAQWARTPFEPLKVFLPAASGRGRYNMVLFGVISFCTALNRGINASRSQYAVLVLEWGQEQFGPFLSLLEGLKVAVLMGLVPLVTRLLQPYYINPAETVSAPLLEPSELTPLVETATDEPAPTQPAPNTSHSPGAIRFDRLLVIAGIFVEATGAFILGANVRGSQSLFLGAHVYIQLAAAVDASFASLMLSLAPADVAAGELFGAFGVLDALSLYFLSAPLYAGIWTATLAVYPAAIFLFAGVCWTMGALMVGGLQLPRGIALPVDEDDT